MITAKSLLIFISLEERPTSPFLNRWIHPRSPACTATPINPAAFCSAEMNALNARQSALAPAARSAGVRGLSSSANIAGAALPRRSAAAAAPRRLSVLRAAPRASYDASSYGPVGGDARIKVSDRGTRWASLPPACSLRLLTRVPPIASAGHRRRRRRRQRCEPHD